MKKENNILSKPVILSDEYNDINMIKRKERDTRHYAPANKEWNNSTYVFNKNNLHDIAAKDEIAANSIKGYFNVTAYSSLVGRSKRRRNLLRRKSTKQLFTSKPEVKQTNDKAIVTIYTYDRENKFYTRKLFFLRKWLSSKLRKINIINNKPLITKFVKFNRKYKRQTMRNKRIIYPNKYYFSWRANRYFIKKRIKKYNVKSNTYKKIMLAFISKRSYLLNLYLLSFFKWYLKKRGLKAMLASRHTNLIKHVWVKGKKRDKIIPFLNSIYVNIYTDEKKPTKKYKKMRHGWNRENEYKIPRPNKPKLVRQIEIKIGNNIWSLKVLESLSIKILSFLCDTNKSFAYKWIDKFNKYKKKASKHLIKKFFKKEKLILKYISKLHINKFKYYAYIPILKNFLSKIYNKKIQLNLVNLKYLQLNTEMFSEAISIKLRKRTVGINRVLKKSFLLAKIFRPKEQFINKKKMKNYLKASPLTIFGRYSVINGKIINKVFSNIFKKSLLIKNKKSNKLFVFNNLLKGNWTTTIRGVLTFIKYKWLTGARIEGKGRLTKRYAAARALFKYKHRGTLRNLEYWRNVENDIQSPSIFMLRGDKRPSTKYSLAHSKRRIGAFGIKGWLSYN